MALGMLTSLVHFSVPVISKCWSCSAWRKIDVVLSGTPVLLSILMVSALAFLDVIHLMNGQDVPLVVVTVLFVCELCVHHWSLIQHSAALWGILSGPSSALAIGLLIILGCGTKAIIDISGGTQKLDPRGVWVTICAAVSLGSTLLITATVSRHSYLSNTDDRTRRSENRKKPCTVTRDLLVSYLMHMICMIMVLVRHHSYTFAALELTGVSVVRHHRLRSTPLGNELPSTGDGNPHTNPDFRLFL
ncbi:hypothetical protein NM688_g5905 [Phlebia brevispora]|uniref:Uncharacterized protein n=1 Tax=Phlebia brevispora TaxID=194682 RepID=A0ACC1SNB9_9APHY|nr:hypothetical protein NM688_g5905 [Phlebia brevispora]